ncbi:hypothetical protein ACFFGT_15805 [Mucilaginibacter angelicae]|uniref:DUF4261 domain-containing protein n=1 Tax=Mucilaginibacter angelicae TaxID=869718 RepID=A0ABV6L8C8_9SPHI
MFSFFKRQKNEIIVPEWASFFSKSEYKVFVDAIDKFFYDRNITYTLGDALINVGPNDFDWGVLGLMNLAQACKLAEVSDRQELVLGHFESMIRTFQFEKDFKEIIDDFNAIEEYIATRLYPLDYLDHGGKENKVYRMLAGEIAEVLVFDLPDAVQTITPEQAGKWKKTWDKLFETGIENIRSKYPCSITREEIGQTSIWFAFGDHFFAPNIIFDMTRNPQLVGSKGSLIGIPHRHTVIIYPIENIDFVNAVNDMIPVIYGMNQEGPGSVSSNLLWYKDGIFENQPYEIEDNTIKFSPTDGFLKAMEIIES